MTAVDAARRRVDELEALLAQLRGARGRVPSLQRPTTAVGSPGTWTGTAAHRLHHDELVPLDGQLRRGLERAEDDVLDELRDARRALDHAVDEEEAERKAAEDAERRGAW